MYIKCKKLQEFNKRQWFTFHSTNNISLSAICSALPVEYRNSGRLEPCLEFDKFILRLSLYTLRCPDPEDLICNRVISDISVVLRETTLTISDSI